MRRERDGVCALVRSVVENGSSIGFMLPLGDGELEQWVESVAGEMEREMRLVVLAKGDGGVVGMVQLGFISWPNQRHRAEVLKLMVHPDARRQGIARRLMIEIERLALEHGKTLLVLDTASDEAETLYRTTGYVELGLIPGFADWPNGDPGDTVFFYKHLVQ